MPILADMNLLLANESDCRFFKFWFHDRVCDGISYQGELYYQFHSFNSQRRDQAYDLGSKLIDRGISVIICCSKQRYLLGINLRNNWSEIGEYEKQQFLVEVQGLESVLSQLLQ